MGPRLLAVDPSIAVALVSIGTAIVTTAGGVMIAFLTNRREAENAADDSRELTLQERITLRDEQLAAERAKVVLLEADLVAERERNARLKAENASLRDDLGGPHA